MAKNWQAFFHSFDRYANPVTLTFNQKRSIKTVPGGFCSIITWILLTYYIVSTVAMRIYDATYVQTFGKKLLDSSDNLFNITT